MSKTTVYFSRFAIFVVYFWFGILKVLGESPATPLVQSLFGKTIAVWAPAIPFGTFIILFGAFEMIIGLLFLIPKLDRISITLLVLHLITTAGPLVLLPGLVWTKLFVPTLEGQYIIKNIIIIALAISILVHSKSDIKENTKYV